MNIVALRLFDKNKNAYYEVMIHWPSLHLHEVYLIENEQPKRANHDQFGWGEHLELHEIRVDPLLFPRSLVQELCSSLKTLLLNTQEPVVFSPRLPGPV